MLSCKIIKISTSKTGKTWLTVSVESEFVYNALVMSTKDADAYEVDQVIQVPQAALRSMEG